jgi:hypothetical protein
MDSKAARPRATRETESEEGRDRQDGEFGDKMWVCRSRMQCNTGATGVWAVVQAQRVTGPLSKMSLISWRAVLSVLDIKLIRTDTTLDLSQKAEKV